MPEPQNVPKLYFKSQCSMSKTNRFFFHLRISIQEITFCKSIFLQLPFLDILFSEIMPNLIRLGYSQNTIIFLVNVLLYSKIYLILKLNNLTDTIGYTYTKVQESVMMSGLLKLKITFTHFMTQIVIYMYLKVVLKFGHSEKHTKFEKIFHLNLTLLPPTLE